MRTVHGDRVEFLNLTENDHKFMPYATFTFTDGQEVSIGMGANEDFNITGNNLSEAAGTSAFPLGVAVGRSITLSINNDRDQYSNYNFLGARINLSIKYKMSNTVATINLGTFTVIDPESYGSTIEITAVDDMYKLDSVYDGDIGEGTTIGQLYNDVCTRFLGAGRFSVTPFPNSDWYIEELPDGLTGRQLIGYIAMFAGGNAIMDENNVLHIKPYDLDHFERDNWDGGVFDSNTPYTTGDNLNGGNFYIYTGGASVDAGSFADMPQIQQLYKHINLSVDTDDVVITGVRMDVDKATYESKTTNDYVLKVENALVKNNHQAFVNSLFNAVGGIRFRPFTADEVSNPLIEFMDTCLVIDRKGNTYQSVVTDIDFNFLGYTTIKCAAESPIRNSSSYAAANTEAIVAARKEATELIDSFATVSNNMMDLISQGFGMFSSNIVQDDGSIKPVLHDQPTLAQSLVMYELTSNGSQVKKRATTTSPWVIQSGTSVNGDALFQTITARMANVDWLRAARINVGNNTSYEGVDGIYVYNGSTQVGRWTKDGIVLYSGTGTNRKEVVNISPDGTAKIAGDISSATGTFSSSINVNNKFKVSNTGEVTATSGTFSGSLNGANITGATGSFSGTLSGASGTFDGTITAGKWVGCYDTNNSNTGLKYVAMDSYGQYPSGTHYALEVATRERTSDSWNRKFYVDYDGNAYVEGTIRATAGYIGNDSIQIDSDGIKFTNETYGIGFGDGCNIYSSKRGSVILQILGGEGGGNVVLNAPNHELHLGFTIHGVSTSKVQVDTTFVDASDRRLKDDIEYLNNEDSLEFINGLKPCKFRYKGNPHRQHGFIAQDVQEVQPDDWDVVTEGSDGMLGVSYLDIIADLVGSVKTLTKRVEALEAEVKALKGGE